MVATALARPVTPTARSNARPSALVAVKPQPSRMSLEHLARGTVVRRRRLVVYGVEGVGKSSFGASAPAPVFLLAEDGADALDVPKFPRAERWQDVLDAVEALRTTDHGFETLVIDTVDHLEPLVHAEVCRAHGVEAIGDVPYGRGYPAALEPWRQLTHALDGLRAEKDMWIVLLAHAHAVPHRDPRLETFDRFTMKLQSAAAAWLREWSDAVLFAAFDFVTQTDKTKRVRAFEAGPRVLLTQETAAYAAKNRLDLPAALPLDWDAFADAARAHAPRPVDCILAELDELRPQLPPDRQTRLAGALEKLGRNAVKLEHLLNRVRADVAIHREQSTEAAAAEKENAQ